MLHKVGSGAPELFTGLQEEMFWPQQVVSFQREKEKITIWENCLFQSLAPFLNTTCIYDAATPLGGCGVAACSWEIPRAMELCAGVPVQPGSLCVTHSSAALCALALCEAFPALWLFVLGGRCSTGRALPAESWRPVVIGSCLVSAPLHYFLSHGAGRANCSKEPGACSLSAGQEGEWGLL